jgi:hypothetical protein
MMVPVPFAQQLVCGHEYHEATDLGDGEMQYCSCDTGAIGRCADDHRPVCGYHSALRDGRRLCTECIARFDADVANATLEAKYGELRARLDKVRVTCAALADVGDPVDRLLALLQLAQWARFGVYKERVEDALRERAEPELLKILRSAARTLLEPPSSDLWDVSSDYPTSWTFKPAALMQHWLQTGRLRASSGAGLKLSAYEKGFFGGMKRVTRGHITGWQIQSGSSGSSGQYGSSGAPDIYALADGTVGSASHASREVSAQARREDMEVTHVLLLIARKHLMPADLPDAVTTHLNELSSRRPSVL